MTATWNFLLLYKKYKLFINYCIIGFSGVALDVIVFYLLTHLLGWHYQIANVFSISCGITNNFFWNAYFNFNEKSKIWLRFLSFYCVGLIGMGISALLLFILVDMWSVMPMIAKGVTILVVTIVQFTLNKKITFMKAAR